MRKGRRRSGLKKSRLVPLDPASTVRLSDYLESEDAGALGRATHCAASAQFAAWRTADFRDGRRWLAYAFRRFMCIFPVYAVVLIAYVAMGELELGLLAPHLQLREGENQFWTIPVECKYYLLLPLIAGAIFWAGRKNKWLGVAASIGAVVAGVGLHALDEL